MFYGQTLIIHDHISPLKLLNSFKSISDRPNNLYTDLTLAFILLCLCKTLFAFHVSRRRSLSLDFETIQRWSLSIIFRLCNNLAMSMKSIPTPDIKPVFAMSDKWNTCYAKPLKFTKVVYVALLVTWFQNCFW